MRTLHLLRVAPEQRPSRTPSRREHFLGCRLVLVRGASGAPLLVPTADGISIDVAEGSMELSVEAPMVRLPRAAATFLRCRVAPVGGSPGAPGLR